MPTCEQIEVRNPKRTRASSLGRDEWFPFYAGFSPEFANHMIANCGLPAGATVMDPWNGGGTTTSSAVLNGYKAIGFDLNPVMAAVAKAKLLHIGDLDCAWRLSKEIVAKAAKERFRIKRDDPLCIWFAPRTAGALRSIERAIYNTTISSRDSGVAADAVQGFSKPTAFLYVALFRAVRQLLRQFRSSNPTWISTKGSPVVCGPDAEDLRRSFEAWISRMSTNCLTPPHDWACESGNFEIQVSSSQTLPLADETVDFVLSSPPYCTRIDYAIATSPELAVLGFPISTDLARLRSQLIGTPTVCPDTPNPEPQWGQRCVQLLDIIRKHPSKAAKTYYYKTYVQYFAGIAGSVSEIARCLRPEGTCILVVQDSYFKGVRVDLAEILSQMGAKVSLRQYRRIDFRTSRTLANVNTRSRRYRESVCATESVLCLRKHVTSQPRRNA